MKKAIILLLGIVLMLILSACENVREEPGGIHTPIESEITEIPETVQNKDGAANTAISEKEENKVKEKVLKMFIGDTAVEVDWEDNESVNTLRELVKDAPLTVQMSMYGGFEQVGSLGDSLPRDDVQITTESGDIVLYSGNQIVVFYGSNSWAYTRLGHITDKTDDEMAELLAGGDVTVTISQGE